MGALDELRKALTSSGDGAALVPAELDAQLHEELLKLQPLAMLMNIVPSEAKTHEFTVRSSHPFGWFEGETTPANAANSVYARKSVQLKILRNWGSVTGFARAVDAAFVDALEAELIGSLEGVANAMEFGILWGASTDLSTGGFTGDAYQFSGIIPSVFAFASGNVIDAGGDKIALDDLDAALAAASGFRLVGGDPKVWAMSMRMKSVVDGLQTKVQLPLSQAEYAEGKLVMAAYGNAPIYESDMVAPAAVTTSPATTGVIAAGGALPDGTYTYKISSVTMYGEQLPGTASANVVAATTNKQANLTWTGDANARLYFIWRNLAAGTFYLIDIIPAKTYDSAGTVNGLVASYSDAGKTATTIKPLAAGEQNLVLANLNPQRGAALIGLVDDMGRRTDGLVSMVELARVKDTYDFMLKSYVALRNIHSNVHAVIRHAKLV